MSEADTDGLGVLSTSDAAAIGFRLVEMADRVKNVDAAVPGTQARCSFQIDGLKFNVVVTLARPPSPSSGQQS